MVLDLIKKSRTHRHFLETSVDEKDILKILSAARYSASGKNKQILRYALLLMILNAKKFLKILLLEEL